MEEQVILVDENDNAIGTMEKLEAHKKGVLHRALSIFIFNTNGELLLQQRAAHKYHSPKLWTNTCCSHQRSGETTLEAANRRLDEEMGMRADLKEVFTFTYKASFDNGLTEHELDHVLVAVSDTLPIVNEVEVMDFKYFNMNQLETDLIENPSKYTSWFKICFPKILKYYNMELASKIIR